MTSDSENGQVSPQESNISVMKSGQDQPLADAGALAQASEPVSEVSGELLRSVTGFESLTVADLRKLAGMMTWRTIAKDQTLIFHLSDDNNAYFLCRGKLKATVYTDAGKEIAYQILESGTIVGEISAIDNRQRTTHVVAESEAIVASLSDAQFQQVMHEFPSVNDAVMQKLTQTVRFLCERVFELSALSVARRINMELIRLAGNAVKGEDGVSLIVEPAPTHAEIASRTNTQREAVTKHLSELKKRKLIELSRRTLIIADVSALD